MRPDLRQTKICPDCAETVKAQARICRFCGYRFEPAPFATPPSATSWSIAQLRRDSPEWEGEMKLAGRWRWLLDVPGSPATPALFIAVVSLGYHGLGPQMRGRQKAGTALAGWALFGGFGTLVLWFAWLFVRMLLLMCAIGLGAAWLLYAPAIYAWQHRKERHASSPSGS